VDLAIQVGQLKVGDLVAHSHDESTGVGSSRLGQHNSREKDRARGEEEGGQERSHALKFGHLQRRKVLRAIWPCWLENVHIQNPWGTSSVP